MLNELVQLCDEHYQSHYCETCSYGINCPHNCEKCLEYIHFPQRAPVKRLYDCKRMADFYVCKYAHKYTSELVYALLMLCNLECRRHLNVLSIGCGPCTDLLALDYLVKEGNYCASSIDYHGIEINTEIWSNIYDDYHDLIPHNWSFNIISEDICDYIDSMIQYDWRPDLILLQYVFSDMHKHTEPQKIYVMIESLARYIDSCERNTYVVCNDINLSIDYAGGREYFDELYNRLCTRATQHKFHFDNSNRQSHYDYGAQFSTNTLFVSPGNELDFFDRINLVPAHK